MFSKSLSTNKTSTSKPLSRSIFLTLHYHMHFINNRNEEIQAKILEFSADRMQQLLHVLILGMWQFYCHSYSDLISLSFLVIGLWTFSWMEPMCAAELTWYTLKVYNWILWNIHDEIDMLYLELRTGKWGTQQAHYANRDIFYLGKKLIYRCPMKYL